MKKTRVIVVDDSFVARKMLIQMINSTGDLEVVGEAVDPHDARDKIKALNPDVLTLDVEMPKMDGITFLKNIMRLRPMPVVMISTLTERGSQVAMEALDVGAVDYLVKPNNRDVESIKCFQHELFEKIRAAALSNIGLLEKRLVDVDKKNRGDLSNARFSNYTPDEHGLILIGASTGGIDAFTAILDRLPENAPPVVIVQHIPAMFSASLASRLDKKTPLKVLEAENGHELESGQVVIANGAFHLTLQQCGNKVVCMLDEGALVSSHRPSVDVMFRSAAQLKNVPISVALLTGMGSDGADGLGLLKKHGCYTVVQDEASSIVWGMPKVAFEQNAHVEVLPLDKIAYSLLAHVGRFNS